MTFITKDSVVVHDTESMKTKRAREHKKYVEIYGANTTWLGGYYGMGLERKKDLITDLESIPMRGSFLDVSCGRGESFQIAYDMDFTPLMGTEIVPELLNDRVVYAECHSLPFEKDSWDVVSMQDVIEHLLPGDDELACRELRRVAKHHILITASNNPNLTTEGKDLHINKRPYREWHELFKEWFAPCTLVRLDGRFRPISEGWRVDLP